ncbi:heterokaryon incompatibility protein-domain-containing protein [Fusarium redolens]|uniref:Heterokaryon incompatibility protein-domain-containing protein n=1 Tax=Fusarium redolens TaxID=48865 RepID=A0A9P9JTX2_FUSRE|nr:heterokaryon incompatibility protein-domain-containing protein [Fusarium redolens]KAH7236818.1 heterokaryon incompatibility protein-domain-containing protein [Fusarium redolens]
MDHFFTYASLPSTGWFRLLTVLPSHDDTSEISCELHHHELAKCPRYEAISYTWGNEDASERMLVDGKIFKLRPNLYAALKAFRKSDEPIVIWADAICINQQDEVERNHQVLQMNKIYSQAQAVDVWFGSANKSSDTGVAFLNKFYSLVYHDVNYQQLLPASAPLDKRAISIYPESMKSFEDFYAPILGLLDDPTFAADMSHAVAFLANSWWRRIWTLQESVLCSNVICWSGPKTFPFENILYFSYFLYYLINHNVWKEALIPPEMTLGVLRRVEDLRKDMVAYKRIGLAMALYSTWNRAASDPRDKVIGLLGIVGPRDDLQPQYSWPVEKVYRAAMRAALVEESNLICLGLISEKKESRNKKLASWVPDFALHSEPFKDYITSLSKVLAKRPIYDICLSQAGIAPTIRTEKDDTESQGVAFWRTVLVDLRQGQHPTPAKGIGPRRLDKNDLEKLSQLDTPEGLEDLLDTWQSCLRPIYRQLRLIEQFNRRFFRTEKGYMGLGPPDIQPGDAICVLLGGCVAYALRRSADETWIYVGECYIHGIMDGEAVAKAIKDKIDFVEYRIV